MFLCLQCIALIVMMALIGANAQVIVQSYTPLPGSGQWYPWTAARFAAPIAWESPIAPVAYSAPAVFPTPIAPVAYSAPAVIPAPASVVVAAAPTVDIAVPKA